MPDIRACARRGHGRRSLWSSSNGSSSTSSKSGGGGATSSASSTSSKASASPITIGTSLSLSGDFSADGQAFQRGYQLWAADQNKAGGLLGHPIKLDVLSDASSPAQVVTNYQKLIGSDKDALVFGPFSSLLTVPGRTHRRALRVRVRRGRGRRSVGVRRGPAQRLRRVDPGQEQPRDVRALDRLAAHVEAPEDGGVRDGQRPVHAAAAPGRPEDPRGGRRQDGPQQGVPGGGHRLHRDRRPGRLGQGRRGPPRLGRRADGVGVHARFIQQHYNPKAFIATAGPDQGAQFIKAVGTGNENGIFVPNGWYGGFKKADCQQMVKEYIAKYGGNASDVNADVAEAYSVGQVLAQAVGHPRLRPAEDHHLPEERRHAQQRPGPGEVRLAG